MLHTKYISCEPHDFLSFSHHKSTGATAPRGMASLDPRDLIGRIYEGVSINNQPIPFPMDRDGHDFHALFQYMFYTWVQNCTHIESFFNKILNVKHGK